MDIEIEGWANVYLDADPAGDIYYVGLLHDTPQEAGKSDRDELGNKRIACLHLKFRPGDGL